VSFLRWAAAVLAAFEAGWMAFDGTRALLVGDYVTPRSGEHAGQLGPWAGIVSALGIEPRSAAMKAFFVVYGVAWLVVIACFVRGHGWARWAMLAAAAGSLWYLWVGTVTSALVLALLLLALVLEHS
jgi:hypothetical protein